MVRDNHHGIRDVAARYIDFVEYGRRLSSALDDDDFVGAEQVLQALLAIDTAHQPASEDLIQVHAHLRRVQLVEQNVRELMTASDRAGARKVLARARWSYPRNQLLKELNAELTRASEQQLCDHVARAVEAFDLKRSTESLGLEYKRPASEPMGRRPVEVTRSPRPAMPGARRVSRMGPAWHDGAMLFLFALVPLGLVATLLVLLVTESQQMTLTKREVGLTPNSVTQQERLALLFEREPELRDRLENYADLDAVDRAALREELYALRGPQFESAVLAIVPAMFDGDDQASAVDRALLANLNRGRMAGYPPRRPVVPVGALAASEWDLGASPPELGVDRASGRSGTLILLALLVGVLPGIVLGVMLAGGRLPFANRLVEFVWEAFVALPAWGMLALGVLLVWPNLVDPITKNEPAAGTFLAGVLLGLLAIPHLAFAVEHGLSNIAAPAKTTPRPFLVALAILSALLTTAARLLGEAVVLLAAVFVFPEVAEPAMALAGILLDGLSWSSTITFEQHMTAAALPGVALTVMSIALFLSVLAQALMGAVAVYGLARFDRDATVRRDHPTQRRTARRGVWIGAIGFAITGLLIVLAMLIPEMLPPVAHPDLAEVSTATGSLSTLHGGDYAAAEAGTLAVGLAFAGAAMFVAMCFGLAPALFIRRRRVRAVLECVWRVPLALPPLGVAVVMIVLFQRVDQPGPTFGTATITLLAAYAPLAVVLLMRAVERYRRVPYTVDVAGVPPRRPYLVFASLLESLGRVPLLVALGITAGVLVATTGATMGIHDAANVGWGDPVRHLGAIALMYSGSAQSIEARAEFWIAATRVAQMTLALLAIGLIAKLAAELSGLLALRRR